MCTAVQFCAVRHCALIYLRAAIAIKSRLGLEFPFEVWFRKQFQLFLILLEAALNEKFRSH